MALPLFIITPVAKTLDTTLGQHPINLLLARLWIRLIATMFTTVISTVNQQSHRMEQGQLWRQYIIAGVANFASASFGYCLGWDAIIPQFYSDETPLLTKPSFHEISIMPSLMSLGVIIGPSVGGLLAAKLGRKWGLLASMVPLLVGWALVVIGTHLYMLYACSLCWGISKGMLFTIVPTYCAEIATDNSRGALGSFFQLFHGFGTLFVYSVALFASFRVVALVGLGGVAVTGLLFFFMPETPTYMLLKGNREAAAKSLMKIRGTSRDGVEAELSLISADVTASLENKATFGDVFKGRNCKAFYISCALVVAQQLSGITVVMLFIMSMLTDSGLNISSFAQNLIIVANQIVASFIISIAVDRLGRRIVLIISTFGTAIGLAIMGTYYTLEVLNSPIVERMWYLPMVGLILFIVTFSWGLGPLPLIMMSELLPVEVKMTASSIVNTLQGILTVLDSMMVPLFINLGIPLSLFIYCVCCVLAFFFVIFAVPETKRKSYREIQDMLSGRKRTMEKA